MRRFLFFDWKRLFFANFFQNLEIPLVPFALASSQNWIIAVNGCGGKF